jgi:hypothetical protein
VYEQDRITAPFVDVMHPASRKRDLVVGERVGDTIEPDRFGGGLTWRANESGGGVHAI